MAEEAIGNGVELEIDYQTGEEDAISNRDDAFGKDTKISELNRKIETLVRENSELIQGKRKSDGRVEELMKEIKELKTDGVAMKDRLELLQKEIEQSSEDKKALQVVSARAVDLETQVARLQHDLVSTMTESDEATAELRKLKDAFEELKQSNLNKEAKVVELEKEKDSLLERIKNEIAAGKKSKSESEIRIRDLEEKLSLIEAREFNNKDQDSKREEETKAKILEKDGKILQLQKDIEGLKSKAVENTSAFQMLKEKEDEIENLKEDLKQSQEKLKETEAKANRLEIEFAKARELDVAGAEKGLKIQWKTAVASTGTVAAAATLLYLHYARRR